MGFLLSGGIISIEPKPTADVNQYHLVASQSATPKQTLQMSALKFELSLPPATLGGFGAFKEETIVVAYSPKRGEDAKAGGQIKVWFSDESALVLGADNGEETVTRQNEAMKIVGDEIKIGDGDGADVNGFVFFPALYIVEMDPNKALADYVYDEKTKISPINTDILPKKPSAVYGNWSVKNEGTKFKCNSYLPPGVDNYKLEEKNPFSAGSIEMQCPAQIVWNVDDLGLEAGKIYRAQFVVHDGDAMGDYGVGYLNIDLR